MDIRVEVTQQNTVTGDTYSLDISEAPKINLEALDVRNFLKRKSSRSQSFALPFTTNNNRFFVHFYEVNADFTSFNPYVKQPARIYDRGVVVLNGYLKLIDVDTVKQVYNVVIFDNVSSLINDIGTSTIRELVDGELDHDLTYTNVVNSWSKTLESGNVIYPFIDWGEGWKYGDGGIDQAGADTAAQITQFRPAVKIYYLLNKMFTDNGYTWDSTFLESTWFKNLYMTFVNGESLVAVDEIYTFQVEKNADQTAAVGEVLITWPVENYDTRGTFASNTFTALETGNHTFTFEIILEETTASAQTAELYTKVDDGSGYNIDFDFYQNVPLASLETKTATGSFTLNLLAGADVQFYVFSSGLDVNTGGKWTLIQSPSTVINSNVNLGDNIDKNLKQKDFLTAIFERFNLIAISNEENPTQLIIEPYNDFYELGTSRDWTNKIDYSEGFVIQPMSDFRSSKITFSDNESQGYLQQIAQQAGFIYGSKEFVSEDPFATGEFSVSSIFEPMPIGRIPASNTFTGANYQAREILIAPRNSKPSIIYYDTATSGNSSVADNFYLLNGSTSVLQTSIPIAASMPIPFTSSDVSADFQLTAFQYNNVVESKSTTPDVFSKYWQQYITDLYSDEIRFVKCKVRLKPSDLNQLKLYDKIFIKDTFYRISKLSGITAGSDEPCTAELIKRVSALVNDCSAIPDTYNADGTISFVSVTTGASTTPTQECCERVDGLYRTPGGTPTCFWRWGAQAGNAGTLEGVGVSALGSNQVANTAYNTQVNGTNNNLGARGGNLNVNGISNTIQSNAKFGNVIGQNHVVEESRKYFEAFGQGTKIFSDNQREYRNDSSDGYGYIVSGEVTSVGSGGSDLVWDTPTGFLTFTNDNSIYSFEIWVTGTSTTPTFYASKYSGALRISNSGTLTLLDTPTLEWAYDSATELSVSSITIDSTNHALKVTVAASAGAGRFQATIKYVVHTFPFVTPP